MSTPWVGSSRRKTTGRRRNHFANRTFCWLPPLKVISRASTAPDGRTSSRSIHCSASARSGLRRRSEEHTSELQSRQYLVCRLLLEKKKQMLVFLHLLLT